MSAADLHPDTGLPRPGTCCGVCPPIAGGGWDCTCPGLPGCPAALADAGLGKSAEAATLAAERDALAARLATVEAERGDLIDRLTVAKALHTPQPGQGPAYCQSCDERWPCPTRAVLSAAPTDTTKETS